MNENKYDNFDTPIGPVVSVWAHLFQARDFRGDGRFNYDITAVLTPQQGEYITNRAKTLAATAFGPEQLNSPFLQLPVSPVESKTGSSLSVIFPGCFVLGAKTNVDNPPQVLMLKSGTGNKFITMPDNMRASFVYDGAHCLIKIDLGTFFYSERVYGVRAQLSYAAYLEGGQRISAGGRPDATQELETLDLGAQMEQAPVPQGQPDQGQNQQQQQQPGNFQPEGQQQSGQFQPQGQQPGNFQPEGQQQSGQFQPEGQQQSGQFQPQGQQPGNFQPQGQQPGNFQPQGRQPGQFQPQGQQPGQFQPQGQQQQPGNFQPQGQQPGQFQPQGQQQQPGNFQPQGQQQQPGNFQPQGQQQQPGQQQPGQFQPQGGQQGQDQGMRPFAPPPVNFDN